MFRSLSAAAVVATIAAGCGGPSLESIARQDSAQTWNEPNPRILSVEHVRLMSGAAANVVRLEGNFRFLCHFRCRATHSKYAVLEVSNQETGYSSSSRAEQATIAAARNASPRFQIFPDFLGLRVRCSIPRGSGGSIEGVCLTEWARHGVTFEEHWPLSAPSGSRHHATWTVTVGPSHRVTSIRLTGDKPPQARTG